jgi:hypothetical protein
LTNWDTIERALLVLTQLDFNLTQLKERVEATVVSIRHFAKHLEELKDLVGDSRNDVGKTKDITQRCRQEKGILKRVKGGKNEENQLVGGTRPEKKKARVTWER